MGASKDQRDSRTDQVVEIEFTVQNSVYPFVGVTEEEQCIAELAKFLPRSDGRYAEFFNVLGVPPDRITRYTDDIEAVETICLSEDTDGGLIEFTVSEGCPAFRLAELGALPNTVKGVNGRGCIIAEIPSRYDPSAVTGTFLEEYPDFELTAKRTKETHTSMLTASRLQQLLFNKITDRQTEVLQTAFEMGYYEWPRDSTGQEVADELGIAPATFSEHIFAAERKILTFLFEESNELISPDARKRNLKF